MDYAASILLETVDGKLIFQHRDDKPNIIHPNKICFFGGHGEENETAIQTAVRELEEETTLKLSEHDLNFMAYVEIDDPRDCHYGCHHRPINEYCFVARHIDPDLITVQEGQGMILVSREDDLSKINFTSFARYMIYLYWGI